MRSRSRCSGRWAIASARCDCLQIEATELAPGARGSAVALFACGFFAGQALGAPLFGALVHGAGFTLALLAVALGVALLGRLVVGKVVA